MEVSETKKIIYLQDRIDRTTVQSEILPKIKYGSRYMVHCLNRALDVAATKMPVLIEGETGVGKEYLARLIHEQSKRSKNQLVIVNCAALDINLINSILFGHVRGAFTGADISKDGFFQIADKSTIFLDEIGELPQEVQTRLLRILQDGTFTKLGETKTRQVDVRIIAATNKKLQREVEKRKFRDDLFYRLNGFCIWIPPLRERPEDIMVLANHFKDQAVSQGTPRILRFSDEALAYMDNYNWPGNVRELKSAVERALVNCSGEEIGPAHLELGSGIMQSNPKQQDGTYAPLTLADYQKYALAMALHHSGGLQSKAAKLLGISPKKIGYQIKLQGIDPDNPLEAIKNLQTAGLSHAPYRIQMLEQANRELEQKLRNSDKFGNLHNDPRHTSLLGSLEKAQKQLQETENRFLKLQAESQGDKKNILRLEKQLADHDQRLIAAKKQLSEVQEESSARLRKKESLLEQDQKAQEELVADLAKSAKEIEKLQQEAKKLHGQIAAANETIEKFKSNQKIPQDVTEQIMQLQGAKEFVTKYPGIIPGKTTMDEAGLYVRIAQFAIHLNEGDGNFSEAARLMGAHPSSLSVRKNTLLKKGFDIQKLRHERIYCDCMIAIGTQVETACQEARKGLLGLLYRFTLGNAKKTADLAGTKNHTYFSALASYGINSSSITQQDQQLYQARTKKLELQQQFETKNQQPAEQVALLKKLLEQTRQLEDRKKQCESLRKSHLAQVEKLKNELREAYESLQIAVLKKEGDISLLKQQHREELGQLDQKLQDTRKANARALASLRMEFNEKTALAEQRLAAAQKLELQFERLRKKNKKLKRHNASLEEEILQQLEKVESLERQLADERVFSAQLGKEQSGLHMLAAKENEVLKIKIKELEKQIGTVNKLQKALSQKDVDIKKLQQLIGDLKSQVRELEKNQKKGFAFFKSK